MSCGVLMYAHNNREIDYIKIACANALMVKKNLQVPVTLVTDSDTYLWGQEHVGVELLNACFESIIRVDRNHTFENKRNYSDTSLLTQLLQFYNCNHWEAYSLTPYDETLFIDVDYLIMSDQLNRCWGSNNDVMINHRIFTPGEITSPCTRSIDEFGIQQYWATVIYFKKSPLAESMFELVKHIQNNYEYYRQLYYFSNGMYRNDNAFSIAVHMLHGFTGHNNIINELPIPGMLMSWDSDDIYKVNGINDITVYAEKSTKGSYILARIKDQDIHIINKWAINRNADRLIELYKDVL